MEDLITHQIESAWTLIQGKPNNILNSNKGHCDWLRQQLT